MWNWHIKGENYFGLSLALFISFSGFPLAKLVAELLAWLVTYSSKDTWEEVTWGKRAEPAYDVFPSFATAQCLEMLQRMDALPAWRLVSGATEPSGLTWIWSCVGCLVLRNWFCKLFIDLGLNNKRNNWRSCKWTACRTAGCGQVGQETVPFHFKPCTSIWFFFQKNLLQ